MEKNANDELMAQYLLGRLSEEEAGRLDERSIADDEFAARLQVVENDLVDAYVSGELSGQALESFKSYYLASPRRREKVAIAQGIQSFTGGTSVSRPAAGKQRQVSAASLPDKATSRKGLLQRYFSGPGRRLGWGMAAALLFVVLASGWLLLENLRLRNQMHQAQVERGELHRREQELQAQLREQGSMDSRTEEELASLRQQLARLEEQLAKQGGAKSPPQGPATDPEIVAFTLAPQTRGGSQVATISLPSDADSLALQLELEPNDFSSYRAELKARAGGAVLWRSARLRATGGGKVLTVRLRAALLKAQRYTIEVQGVSAAGAPEIIGSYLFRVVK